MCNKKLKDPPHSGGKFQICHNKCVYIGGHVRLRQRLPQCNANTNFNEIYMRLSRFSNIIFYVLRSKVQYCLCTDRISKVSYYKYCTVPMR